MAKKLSEHRAEALRDRPNAHSVEHAEIPAGAVPHALAEVGPPAKSKAFPSAGSPNTVPSEGANPAPGGRRVVRHGPTVPVGRTELGSVELAPKHKRAVTHHQKHHDRNESGTDQLHGKVRSGKRPVAGLRSELDAPLGKGSGRVGR
jgi:hypothetical protein